MSLPRRPRHTTHARPFFVSIFSKARHAIRRSKLWRAVAIATTVVLAMGLGVSGVALSASAHHNTVNGIAQCGTTTGTWNITWTIKNSETDLAEEISATSNPTVVPLHTAIAPGGTFTKVETVTSTAPKTLTVSGHWVRNNSDVFDNNKSATVTSFPTNCTSVEVVCATSNHNNSLSWTKDATLSTATVTLKSGFTRCDVSLNSYETDGPDWASSGTQQFVDHDSARLTTANPTVTLTVDTRGCFQQQDLYIGTQKFDGIDGALPHYNDSPTPTNLLDHWNGKVGSECTIPTQTVTSSDFTCGVVGTMVLPAVTGVAYKAYVGSDTVGTSVVAGSIFATSDWTETGTPISGAVTIKAFKSGTKDLSGTSSWPFTFSPKSAQDCATKPPQEKRTVTTYDVDCSLQLTTTTTSYTTDYVWNSTTSKYELGKEVAGTPVVTTKTTTLDELKTLGVTPPVCALKTDADPTDGACAPDGKTLISGYITVDLKPNVSYRIVGNGIDINPVTTAKTEVPAGDYVVTATATAPYTLDQSRWEFTVKGGACLPTLADWDANATATNQVCNSDGGTASGYITVDFITEPGFEDAVQYFVGTTRLTSAKTAMAPGTYTVTAKTADPADGIIGETSWTLTIASPSAACPQLKTLAFTGANGNMGGMLIIALFLLLGGAGVYTASRLRRRES